VPVLGPVLMPTIAGKDLFQPQTAFGPTPTIAWQAPARGAPTEYHVAIIHFSATAAGTMHNVLGSITTTATSVVVPPGILIPGEWYAIGISADTAPNPNAPERRVFPEAFSSIVSALMTPVGPVDGGGKGRRIMDSIPMTNANVESLTRRASYSRATHGRIDW
jgi:hypothetical protein